MQRKILWGMAALVLLFVFAGCSQPSDFTFKQTPNALPAPDFEITAYDGLILLRWKPVTDASGYEVYRYDTVAKVTTQLSVPAGQLYYTDWVSWSNQLQDKRDYEYTVVAVSKSSNPRDGAFEGTVAFLNGVAKKTIRATIPADLTLSLSGITYTELDSGQVLVKIPNQVNQTYSVAYTLGTDNDDADNPVFVRELTDWSVTANKAGQWYDPIITATFMPVGPKNSIVVRATFGGGTSYYTTAKAEETIVVGELAGALAVTSFRAIRASDADGAVNFTWEGNGEAFSIYKAELDSDNWYNPNPASVPYPDHGSTAIGNWKEIALKTDWAVVDLGDDGYALDDDGVTWKATETVTNVLGDYIYGIVARSEGKVSSPQFDIVKDASVIVDPDFSVAYKTDFEGKFIETKAQIAWNKDNGTAAGTYTLTEDGTDITPPVATYDVRGYNVVERDLAPGKTYTYELTITKNGAVDKKSYKITGPTSAVITGLGISYAAEVNNNQAANSISITLSIGGGNGKLPADKTIEIYRRIIGKAYGEGPNNNNYVQYPLMTLATAGSVPTDGTLKSYLSTFVKVDLGAKATVAKDTGDGEWYFNDGLGTNDINNVYQYVLILDGGFVKNTADNDNPEWGKFSGLVFQPLGWKATALNSISQVSINSTGTATTAAPGTPSLPAYTVQFTSGSTVTAYINTSSQPVNAYYSGPNISGLPIKIRYEDKTTPTAVKRTIDATIGQVSRPDVTTQTAPATNYTTTVYWYTFSLPYHATNLDAFDWTAGGSIEIFFPWSKGWLAGPDDGDGVAVTVTP